MPLIVSLVKKRCLKVSKDETIFIWRGRLFHIREAVTESGVSLTLAFAKLLQTVENYPGPKTEAYQGHWSLALETNKNLLYMSTKIHIKSHLE